MSKDNSIFFRSISLGLDIDHPDRFAHYYPTSKSANVVKAIVQGKPDATSIVVASYGSGKSLAAGIAALLVDNSTKARKISKTIADRIAKVDKRLGEHALQRINSKQQGSPILLEGYQDNLAAALLNKAKRRLQYLRANGSNAVNLNDALDSIAARARMQNIDRISIVWDEFGQHLESLASSGQAEALLDVQRVAEWATRQSNPSASLTLLLHQNIFRYATNLSQSARTSWRKIEGRFRTIRYVEDSNEMYELIASVISELRPNGKQPSAKTFTLAARGTSQAGMFQAYSGNGKLPQVLSQAYPLLPSTLHMLPRMASRLAQKERTIFSFLRDIDLSRPVSMHDMYKYFSPSMEADIGVGGAYRRWLETESALSKVSAQGDKEVIAAAALLGLGISGERTHTSKARLAFAVTGASGLRKATASKVIDRLVKRKLLLYRKNIDDVSVWHGTDIDVRKKLENERNKLAALSDVMSFLQKEHPALGWRPVKHNIRYSIRRYYQGRYALAQDLIKLGEEHPELALRRDEDGAIVYCLANSRKDIEAILSFVKSIRTKGNGLLFAIPSKPMPVAELVREILALRNLQQDSEFTSADPYAMPELQYLIDAAQENLRLMLQRLVRPNGTSSTWIANGRELNLGSEYDLRNRLSQFTDKRFKRTPVFKNELVVRKNLSRPMVNARKKLLLGILEHTGRPNLGFDPQATTPDATMYRTILQHTGLYKEHRKKWLWAKPHELESSGLKEVWKVIEGFFATPGDSKQPAELINILVSKPYGTRQGLVPILFAAGMKAFGKIIAIKHNGIYLPDILASEIEDICNRPDQYTVDVFDADKYREHYLKKLIDVFSHRKPENDDLLRELYDAIISWRQNLPAQAFASRQVSKKTRRLQKALQKDFDPAALAFSTIPELLEEDWKSKKLASGFRNLVQEIENVVSMLTAKVIAAIHDHLTVTPDTPGDALDRALAWASCFEASNMQDSLSKAFLARCIEAPKGRYTEASFARALSAILLGRDFDQWDDENVKNFSLKLREKVNIIEQAAIMSEHPSKSLAPLVKTRIEYLKKVLEQIDSTEASLKPTRKTAAS